MSSTSPDGYAAVAARSAQAFLSVDRWLHRRVESVVFIDKKLIRRRVSVDFTIPDTLPAASGVGAPSGAHLFYVPLAVLAKWPPLLELDLVSDDQAQPHLLTARENARMDAALLGALLSEQGAAVTEGLSASIRILAGPTGVAPEDLREAIADIRAAVAERGEADQRRRIVRLAEALGSNYVLWFPIHGAPGERHVVKLAYDEPHQGKRTLGSLLRSYLTGRSDDLIEIPHLGESGSYHLDVTAPQSLHIARAPELFVLEERTPDDQAKPAVQFSSRAVGQRAHAYVTGQRDTAGGYLWLSMAALRRGFLTGALIASAAIAALLTAFWLLAPGLSGDVQSSTAVLLIAPGLLSLLTVRPAAHPRALEQLAGARLLLLLSGTLSVAAAVGLIYYDGQLHCIESLWRGLAIAGWVVVLTMLTLWLSALSDGESTR